MTLKIAEEISLGKPAVSRRVFFALQPLSPTAILKLAVHTD